MKTAAICIELIAIVLMAIGIGEGMGNNPGVYLFCIGTALAVCGGCLWAKFGKR